MHQFHGQPPQNRSTKSKKLWFRPLQLCLSAHVLHFFKIMSNTLMIFVTNFFHSLNVKKIQKNISCTSSMDNHLKIKAQNRKKLWFQPLQLCLRANVLHFFKIMSNTLMMCVPHFFYSLNVRESKKNYFMHQFHRLAPKISCSIM